MRISLIVASFLLLPACANEPALTFADAEAAYKAGNYKRARSALQIVSAIDPQTTANHLLRAQISLSEGDGADALDAIARARQKGIAVANLAPMTAEALVLKGDRDRAVAILTSLSPRDEGIALYVGGLAKLQAGNVIEAHTAFERARQFDPQNARIAMTLAKVQLQFGLFDKAVATATQVVRLAPENAAPHLLIAEVYHRKSNHRAALAAFAKAVALDGENIDALIGQAESHYLIGENRRAAMILDRVETLAPSTGALHKMRAKIAVRAKRFDEAAEHLLSVGGAITDDPEAQLIAGDIALSRGAAWTAVSHYEKAVNMRPDLTEYRAKLIHALVQTGQPQAADRAITDIPVAFLSNPSLVRAINAAKRGPAVR